MNMISLVALCSVMMIISRVVIGLFNSLVKKAGWEKYTVAGILVALITTAPELSVGVAASLQNKGVVALGSVIGSNIVNLSLIVGVAVMISGSVGIVGDFVKKELGMAFLAGLGPLILLMDGRLSRWDGLILLLIYFLYIYDLLFKKNRPLHHHERILKTHLKQEKIKARADVSKALFQLVAGMLSLLGLAYLVVRLAVDLAESLNMPVGVIGLVVVAIGTSLPELMLTMGAIKKKEVALVFGDLLGSVVANATLVVGITAVISPFGAQLFPRYALAIVSFMFIFGLFWMFTSTKRKLERWEGMILVGVYLVFVGLELMFG